MRSYFCALPKVQQLEKFAAGKRVSARRIEQNGKRSRELSGHFGGPFSKNLDRTGVL
jgi:hypothetical protein